MPSTKDLASEARARVFTGVASANGAPVRPESSLEITNSQRALYECMQWHRAACVTFERSPRVAISSASKRTGHRSVDIDAIGFGVG